LGECSVQCCDSDARCEIGLGGAEIARVDNAGVDKSARCNRVVNARVDTGWICLLNGWISVISQRDSSTMLKKT